MFESILIKGSDNLDAGHLAEAMLFYGEVKLVCYYGTLKTLLKQIPPLILLRALEQGCIQIYYAHEQSGVMTSDTGTKNEKHDFSRVSLADTEYPDVVEEIFFNAAGKTSQAKISSKKFAKLVIPISYEGFDTNVVFNDVLDQSFMSNVFSDVIQVLVPRYQLPNELVFNATRDRFGISIETNADYDAINNVYHQHMSKKHSSINSAYLLTFLQEAHLDIYFSSKLTSEIATSQISTRILEKRFANILNVNKKSVGEIQVFTDLVLNDGYAIREAINSGKCNWIDYLKLLEKAEKFKTWLKDKPPDTDLLKEYLKAGYSKSWLEKTPMKDLRWVIFNGAGFVADKYMPGSGLVISALDTYLIGKIASGWKPHHFVETRLKPTISAL
jgi:hypothetical protein